MNAGIQNQPFYLEGWFGFVILAFWLVVPIGRTSNSHISGARSPPSQSMRIERSCAIAALILLLFSAIAAALFGPFSVPVEIELAIPMILAGWVDSSACNGISAITDHPMRDSRSSVTVSLP